MLLRMHRPLNFVVANNSTLTQVLQDMRSEISRCLRRSFRARARKGHSDAENVYSILGTDSPHRILDSLDY